MTLTVPIDLGNEYMNNIGIVPWTFMVEKIEGGSSETPQTGDWFSIAAWSGAAAILATMIVMVLVASKCRKKAE